MIDSLSLSDITYRKDRSDGMKRLAYALCKTHANCRLMYLVELHVKYHISSHQYIATYAFVIN